MGSESPWLFIHESLVRLILLGTTGARVSFVGRDIRFCLNEVG